MRKGQQGGLKRAEKWSSEDADEILATRPHNRGWSRPLRRHVLWGIAPTTVAECPDGPCPWVRCRYHTAVAVEADGSMTIYRQGLWPDTDLGDSMADEMARGTYETCALRQAAKGAQTPTEVGEAMALDPKRVRQIEDVAVRKLRKAARRIFGVSGLGEILAAWNTAEGEIWPDWGT